MNHHRDPEDFLPLPAACFHILLVLGRETMHGYALMNDLEARTEGRVTLLPGTLYTSMARLLEDGLVVEVAGPEYEKKGGRRRYYQSTPLGLAVAAAEATRLDSVLAIARESGVLRTDSLGSEAS